MKSDTHISTLVKITIQIKIRRGNSELCEQTVSSFAPGGYATH
jgi:hypothetical protein